MPISPKACCYIRTLPWKDVLSNRTALNGVQFISLSPVRHCVHHMYDIVPLITTPHRSRRCRPYHIIKMNTHLCQSFLSVNNFFITYPIKSLGLNVYKQSNKHIHIYVCVNTYSECYIKLPGSSFHSLCWFYSPHAAFCIEEAGTCLYCPVVKEKA